MTEQRAAAAGERLAAALAKAGVADHPHGGPMITPGRRPFEPAHLWVCLYLSEADADRLAAILLKGGAV
jgi:hypothetical protein